LKICPKGGVGFAYAIGIPNRDGCICRKGRQGGGHGQAVIAHGINCAAPQMGNAVNEQTVAVYGEAPAQAV